MTITRWSVPAPLLTDALAECRISDFVTMPDYVQIALNERIAGGALGGVRVIDCASEDEALCVAFGLHVAGRRPYLSMQNQGLFAGANALRTLARTARAPLPIMAGQWGRELANLGHDPSRSSRIEVRMSEPLLDALEIPHYRLESPDDIGVVREAFDRAHHEETATVVLVGAHTSWE
jgi:sulfopyruvate decarboxylase subunit alpha